MNDPVIERVAREDPAVGVDPQAADELLARLLATVDESTPATTSRGPRDRPPGRPRDWWSRRLRAVFGAVVVAAIVAVVAIVAVGGRHTPPPARVVHRTVAKPVRLVPAGAVHVVVGPADLLAADGSLWVAGAGFVARLNPADGHVQARIKVPARVIGPAQLAAGAGSIWVAYQGQRQVQRIDPRSDRVVATIGLGGPASGGGIAVADGDVWASIVSPARRGHVLVIDPRTDHVSGPPAAVGTGAGRLHVGLGSIWVQNISALNATASRIDPVTRAVQQLSITGEPMVAFGHVWVLGTQNGRGVRTLYRYVPHTPGDYFPAAAFPRGGAVAFGAGDVWVLSYPRSRSTKTFQPGRGTASVTPVARRPYHYGLPVGRTTKLHALQPDAIAVAGRNLWIADYASGRLLHFQIRR
jgi:hypothetical protein